MNTTFRGGITFSPSLRGAKSAALNAPIRVILPPLIRLPLTEYTPVVKDGDTVGIGDVVAVGGDGFPLHSGLSGHVHLEEQSTLTADGNPVLLLTVVGDGTRNVGTLLPPLSGAADRTAIVQRMYDAGLVGMGGAGFPTYHKYRGHTADTLFINACECEPYLACDGRLVLEQPDSVRDGVEYLRRAAAVPATGVYMCAEHPRVAQAITRIAAVTGWHAVRLPSRYPQGSEKQLIAAVLHRQLPADTYPVDAGVIVSNLSTAVAMADAARGLPLTHRVVTVSGEVEHPCNLLAPIGTPLRLLMAEARPRIHGRRSQLIAGGPMTGQRVVSADAGLTKTCGGVLLLPQRQRRETPCIRCGACVRVCPSGLMPLLLEHADTPSLCRRLRADACLVCGCCSQACPAERPLAARIARRKELS